MTRLVKGGPWSAERRTVSSQTWHAVLEEVDKGRHPSHDRLADLVVYDGTPTPRARRYVAERLRGAHRLIGRPKKDTDAHHWARLREAHRLHEAVELYAAAYRMQKVRAPKTRAQDRVKKIAKFAGDRRDFVRRKITEPLRMGSGGWRLDGPLLSPAEATRRLREAIDAGTVELDRVRGWVAKPPPTK